MKKIHEYIENNIGSDSAILGTMLLMNGVASEQKDKIKEWFVQKVIEYCENCSEKEYWCEVCLKTYTRSTAVKLKKNGKEYLLCKRKNCQKDNLTLIPKE